MTWGGEVAFLMVNHRRRCRFEKITGYLRRIMGVERANKRRMDELRVRGEVGVKESFMKKLLRSRLKWARYMERMRDEKLAETADAQKVQRKRRQGTQQKIEGVKDC